MNMQEANAIPLPEILNKIGCNPVKQKVSDMWYHSPFRSEKTPSFHVNAAKNVWYDFGIGKGGTVIDFACGYLESQGEDSTPRDALRWVNNMMVSPSSFLSIPKERRTEPKKALTLSKVYDLQDHVLTEYLQSRGIALPVAKKYLKEVIVNNANTGRKFLAIGLATESDGYELRNRIFKGSISTKSISFIRGKKVPAVELHIFEGMMDFLSAVSLQKDFCFAGDAIVLNSVASLPQVFPYIKGYVYRSLYTWFDNDKAGNSATKALQGLSEREGLLTFQAMNKTYAPYKDVNEWHIQRTKPIPQPN